MEQSKLSSQYHKHIESKHDWYDLKLKEVWQYRDLIMLFTKRNFITRYKQTVLGPAWLFINPVISSLIYCFIFGGIAGISTNGVPQMLFYLSGNAMWTFFSSSFNRNAATFTSNAAVFGKVYFPRLTMPISNVLTSIIEFAIQFLLVLGLLIIYVLQGTVQPDWGAWLAIPLILIELGAMGLGVGIIISSWTTKYRDLSILVSFAIQLWMYITPVVYPLSQAGEGKLRTVLLINPVTAPMEVYRHAVIGQGEIAPVALIWSGVFTVTVLFAGIIIFNKVEKTFMDTV